MVTQDKRSEIYLMPQIRLSLLIAIPLLVIVNTVIWHAYSVDIERERQEWLTRAEVGLDAALITIDQLRNDLYGDLRLLSNSPNLLAVLDDASKQRLLALAAEWEVFAVIKRRYDQIRWLDSSGMERLRVNLTPNDAARVAEEELQDKSERYYFRDAMTLQPGEIYASRIDLNIERGVIEKPYKPMLRLAVPVTDSQGRSQGLLLVNVLAKFILDGLVHHANLSKSHLLLLDRSGYYLRGFDADQAWGFMLHNADDAHHRFDKAYPSVWREMARNGSGFVADAKGLFVYRTMKYGSEGFGHRYMLVEALNARELAAMGVRQREAWLSISLLVSLLLAVLSFFTAHYRLYGGRR